MSLNSIALCGRMVRDPELKRVADKSCVNFTLAVDRDYRNKGEKITDFIECTAWGATADFIGRYCRKGREMTVKGRMESRKWQDKDGKNRTSWYVNCEGANGVGSRQEGQTEAPSTLAAESLGAPVPERQPEYSQSYWQQGMGYQMPPEDYAMLTDDDSQLPF